MLSHYDEENDKIVHRSVNACLMPLCSVDGMAVTTVEGIGSTRTVLHPCQERIAKAHGSQCGFCTPGFVMSMYSLLRNNSSPTEEEIEGAFEGACTVSSINLISPVLRQGCSHTCRWWSALANHHSTSFQAGFAPPSEA